MEPGDRPYWEVVEFIAFNFEDGIAIMEVDF